MSTPAIPNDLSVTTGGAIYFRSDLLEENFQYVEDYLNGQESEFITSTEMNTSARLSLAQVAQNRSLSFFTLVQLQSTASKTLTIPIYKAARLDSVALNIEKSGSSDATGTVTVLFEDSRAQGCTLPWLDTSGGVSWGWLPYVNKPVPLAPGSKLLVTISGLSSNVVAAVARVTLSHYHTSD